MIVDCAVGLLDGPEEGYNVELRVAFEELSMHSGPPEASSPPQYCLARPKPRPPPSGPSDIAAGTSLV